MIFIYLVSVIILVCMAEHNRKISKSSFKHFYNHVSTVLLFLPGANTILALALIIDELSEVMIKKRRWVKC